MLLGFTERERKRDGGGGGGGRAGGHRGRSLQARVMPWTGLLQYYSQPVWPGGKALGW